MKAVHSDLISPNCGRYSQIPFNNLLTYSMGLASLRLKSVVVLVAGFVTMVVLGPALLVLGIQLAVRFDDFLGLLVKELESLDQVADHCERRAEMSAPEACSCIRVITHRHCIEIEKSPSCKRLGADEDFQP